MQEKQEDYSTTVKQKEQSHLDKVIQELGDLSTSILGNLSETNDRICQLGGNVLPPEDNKAQTTSVKYDGKIGYLFEIIEILKNTRDLSRSINRQLEIMV